MCIQGFGGKTLEKRDHLADLHMDGSIILEWVFKKWRQGNMNWIDLAQEGDRWWALVTVVRFHKMWGIC
jgi:hypothetical protein